MIENSRQHAKKLKTLPHSENEREVIIVSIHTRQRFVRILLSASVRVLSHELKTAPVFQAFLPSV